MVRLTRCVWVFVLISAFVAVGARAQETFGTITGSVLDPSGAPIPGAKVVVTNTDKGVVVREVTTDERGFYTVPKLVIGRYSVAVEASGFKRVEVSGIMLNVAEVHRTDVKMEIGDVATTVTVESAALQVESETANVGTLISGDQVRELSLNNRNWEQLVTLSPGVSYGGGDQLYIGTTNPSGETNVLSFSINGQRTSANLWSVDGADNVDRGSNLTLLNYPSVDAIAEFKVQRNIYSAEFGRAAAGNVNVITRSGTKDFHGNAYEFVRNDYFNANGVINNARGIPLGPLRYNDFGWTIGGPVIIPGLYNPDRENRKTFFFFSQEIRRINQPATVTAFVPTAQEKQGIFTREVCVAPNTYQPGDNSCPAGSTGFAVAAINPIAQEYLTAIFNNLPDPDNPATHQLFIQRRAQFNARQELARVDHVFGPRWSVFVRFLNDTIPTTEPGGLFTNSPLPGVSNTSTDSPGRSWVAKSVNTFTPTFLMEAGYAYSYGAIVSRLDGLLSSSRSTITTPLPFPVTLGRIPSLTFTSGGSSVTGFGPYDDFNRNHNVFANLSKLFNRHTVKFGFTYNHYQKTENASGNNASTFNFNADGAVTTGSTDPDRADKRFQQAWANFLVGDVRTFSQVQLDLTPDIQTNQFEWYVQDSWKVRPNLTLDVGLRHSLFRQPHDENGLLTTFDPDEYDPAVAPTVSPVTGLITSAAGTYDPLNGIIVASAPGAKYGNKVAAEDNWNLAPRLGFAWDPWSTGKTALRGGYGISFDSGLVGILEQNIFVNPPFTASVTINDTRFEDPTVAAPVVSSNVVTLRATSPTMKIPYSQSWSLDLQQELPWGVIMAVGYYGNKGTNLIGTMDLNQPTPGQLLIRNGVPVVCTAGQTNTPCQTTGTASPHINAVRPFLGYGPINSILSVFTSNYNSMQISMQKQFKGTNSVNMSFTWSHGLTTAQTDRSSSPQNHYNLKGEYGASQIDRRLLLNVNWIYELPWMKNRGGFLGHALGGWQTSGILYAYTGLPLTVTTSGLDPAGQGYNIGASLASGRPDLVGFADGAKSVNFQAGTWLNTAAFAAVCPSGQTSTQFCADPRPGTSGRGVVYGPGFWRLDFSVYKNFQITEQVRFQFRTETFNLLNHTNPLGVNTTQTSTTFGRITSYRSPREMQFGFKLSF